MTKPINKLEAARRQLESAIDLYFEQADSLTIHTLAWAAFKVLFDAYPHHSEDGFSEQMNDLIKKEGWNKFAAVPNFLKHADRDPNAELLDHHPLEAFQIIGLSTLLYKRSAGKMTVKMMGFDNWVEWLGADELGVEELDNNKDRVAEEAKLRNYIKDLPYADQMQFAQVQYDVFVKSFDDIKLVLDQSQADGKTLQDLLDELHTEESP